MSSTLVLPLILPFFFFLDEEEGQDFLCYLWLCDRGAMVLGSASKPSRALRCPFFFLFPPITIQKRPSLFLVIVRPYICILYVHKQRRKRKEKNTIDRQLWSRDCSASRGRVGLPRLCVQIVQTLTFGGRPVERGGGM